MFAKQLGTIGDTACFADCEAFVTCRITTSLVNHYILVYLYFFKSKNIKNTRIPLTVSM